MNINEYRKKFYNLLENKLGNVKPLICESEIDEDSIDLSKTYLNPEEIISRKKTNTTRYGNHFDAKRVSDIKGNQFKDAESSASNEYGITFDKTGGSHMNGGVYKVNFPIEFILKYFSLPTSQVLGQLGPYGDEHGDRDVPMNAEYGVGNHETSIVKLLNNVNIITEGYPTNRIHFPSGIPESLRGSGLGYIIYESFIKSLGWGSSQPNASGLAQVVWSKLAKDPDFYSFVLETHTQSIFVISKQETVYQPDEIIRTLLNNLDGTNVKIILGDDIKKDFPEMVNLSDNPSLEIFKSSFNSLKSNIEYVITLIDENLVNMNTSLRDLIQKKSIQVMEKLSSEEHPYPLFDSIYDEVNSLFKQFIHTYYDSKSVSFGKDDLSKWVRKENGGSSSIPNFESTLNATAEFFYHFMRQKEAVDIMKSSFN
jgi:hypothetical protein